ncbi:rod shape-determining protein MreD [Sphingomonas arenae]|uniref:rod shape-determining protein MreD n=1 Tax=Sphingomonas arenae TaxID=2812555 RepID=UPI001968525B|nr:rod shape-determining protein MreD [Sphingomonas arenae]
MVRSALGRPGSALDRGPKRFARFIPAWSVAVASCLCLLPIVTQVGWFPDFGFLLLLAWRLLRGDVIPAWWAAPLGLFNDVVAGGPIGLSVAIWTGAMILLDLLDRRTMWRDYWVEWGLAAVLILLHDLARWEIDGVMGANSPFSTAVPPLVIAILAFPLAAWAASRIDRWRLGR